jgi:exosome complex component RRP4
MSELKVKDRDVVVPGEVLAVGMEFLPSYGTYRSGEEIRAGKLGLMRIDGKVLKIIPVAGRYHPKVNDVVIGQVSDILISGWRLNLNCAYSSVLSMKDATSQFIERGADLSRYYALGDYVVMKITNVTSQKLVDVTMKGLRKLAGGRILEVNTNKVPRIIGKQGSMVSMIKDATGCRIIVGQNGVVWLEGEPEMESIAIEAIQKIEREGHLAGMTDKIKEFLESKTKKGGQ